MILCECHLIKESPILWDTLGFLVVFIKNKMSFVPGGIAHKIYVFSSVQLLSHVQLFATPWTTALQASLSITNSQSLL